MFWAGFFREAGSNNVFHNAQYRIRKISIPLPKMEVDIHEQLRVPIFKSATYSQDISIDWFEDVYHSVKKYHQNWHGAWYNRQFDVLRCGVAGKFRQLTVVAYHHINDPLASNSLIETPVIQPVMAFRIGGLVPLEWGSEIIWDHNADGNDTMLQCRYKCGIIEWLYNQDFSGENPQMWNPTGFDQISTSNPDGDGSKTDELTRRAHK